MRKIAILMLLILLCGWITASTQPTRFGIGLGLAGLMPADGHFRDTYSSSILMPRLDLGYRISDRLSVWTAYSGFSRDGTGVQSGAESSSRQQYLSAGLAYRTPIAAKLDFVLAAGPLLALYREQDAFTEVSDSTVGADLHAGLRLELSRGLGLQLDAGYFVASDSYDGESFRLGGLWAGAGLRINL